jgi:hypothetical protein
MSEKSKSQRLLMSKSCEPEKDVELSRASVAAWEVCFVSSGSASSIASCATVWEALSGLEKLIARL